MRKSKRFLVYLLALVLIVATAGCAGSASEGVSAGEAGTSPAALEEFISMGTSSSGGTFNTLGVAIAQMWSEQISGTQFSAEVTGGSSENCVRVGNGEIQMAFSAASSAYEAYYGEGQFEGQPIEEIRAIANMYPAIMQMPVLKSSGVAYVNDITGKRINIGQAGSGSEAQAISILESYGIPLDSFSPQQLSHANASDALIDEKLDGYINLGSLGQSHQMKAMSSGKAILASFGPDDKIENLIAQYPYYYKYVIPAGSYPNQDEDVDTIATGTLMIVGADVSDELVYQATKALFENVDVLAQSQSIAEEIQLESALNVSGVPLHPGAERYYREVGALQ